VSAPRRESLEYLLILRHCLIIASEFLIGLAQVSMRFNRIEASAAAIPAFSVSIAPVRAPARRCATERRTAALAFAGSDLT
jgi:hypothetical protein